MDAVTDEQRTHSDGWDTPVRGLGDVFPTLRRTCWVIVALSLAGLVVGLVKLDRANRGLTPPSTGAHGEVISPYDAVALVLAGSVITLLVTVLVLVLSYKRLR